MTMEDPRTYYGATYNEIRHSTLHGGQTWNIIRDNSPPRDDYGGTDLHLAAYNGVEDQVLSLLNSGGDIDIEARDNYGHTALHRAVAHTAIVQILLQAGANVNAQDDLGKTALHHAARKGYLNMVKALLHAGTDLQAQDNNGKTALHHVAEKGNVDVSRLLLLHGIDRNTTDNDGKTALELAIRCFLFDNDGT